MTDMEIVQRYTPTYIFDRGENSFPVAAKGIVAPLYSNTFINTITGKRVINYITRYLYNTTHVTFVLDNDNQSLQSVYFGSSTLKEGRWVDKDQVQLDEFNRPLIFVTRNTHSNQPLRGEYLQYCGLWNDVAGGNGRVWRPVAILMTSKNTPPGVAREHWMEDETANIGLPVLHLSLIVFPLIRGIIYTLLIFKFCSYALRCRPPSN